MPPAELAASEHAGSLRERFAARVHAWSRRRQGADLCAVTLARGRIYIVPSWLGVAYALLLFAMLLAGLNYGNNLALALTFLLTAIGWVAMHDCHRNLQGLRIAPAGTRSPFAGDLARFDFALYGDKRGHYDLALVAPRGPESLVSVGRGASTRVSVGCPSQRRGWLKLARVRIGSSYPLGLFRAWTWLHPDLQCVIYPRPAERAPFLADAAGAPGRSHHGAGPGDEDFRGLRDRQPADPVRRIAWKAYARTEKLSVSEYQGEAARPAIYDFAAMPGPDSEDRLAQLARLVVDAEARGERYGVRLPAAGRPAGLGPAHRHDCLALLGAFGEVAR
jgi:uncharacterized protein (DUF58 family)